MTEADKIQQEQKRVIFNALFEFLERKVDLFYNWTVLEFGVGKWGFGQFYKELFERVIGLDIEDYSSFHPNIDFVIYDGKSKIPLLDQGVDLIVSHSVLEHVASLIFLTSASNLFFASS